MGNRFTVVVLASLLVLAACGGAEQAAPSPTSLALPTTSSTTDPPITSAATTTTTSAATGTTVADKATVATPTRAGTFGAAVLGNENQVAATSGRFEAVITMIVDETSEIPGEVSISIYGAFNGTGDSELTMDWGDIVAMSMAAEGGEEIPDEFADVFSEPIQIKVIGDKSYMKWSFFAMFLGTDKWIESDADESADMTSGFGFGADGDSPTELLDALADANADVEEIGREDVRGVATTHYRAVLDIEALSQDLSVAERAELEADLGELGMTDFLIDVWVGDDGNVYRYSIVVDGAAAGGDLEGLESMTMVFEMWDHGADIVIEPPPSDEIATEDEISFSFDA